MKFKLVLFEEGDGPLDLRTTVICAQDSRAGIDAFIARGRGPGLAPMEGGFIRAAAGAKGKLVQVVDLAEEAPPDFHIGKMFACAAEASRALAYPYNAVSVQLAQAARQGKTTATLRGVTFSYSENIEVRD